MSKIRTASHGTLYGVHSLYCTQKSTTQNQTNTYYTGSFLNLVSAEFVRGSEKINRVMVEEFYWLFEICK